VEQTYRLELKKYRLQAGMTQKDLANAIGIKQDYVSRWERGYSNLSAEMAFKICTVLDISLNDLLGWKTTTEQRENQRKVDFLIEKMKQAINDFEKMT
jgi:transcriptional regulator with XRE-family HTH domain